MSSIQFTARPRRPRWHVPVAIAFVLATVGGGVVDSGGWAGAAPPDHAKGGGGSDGEKCHPKKGCPDDTTAPDVSIVDPDDSASVSGALVVAGTSTDDTAVESVQVAVDGGAFAAASGTDSWSHELDASAWADGEHVITARATDTAGNVQDESITVIAATSDSTAPGIEILAPVDGETVSGIVEISGTASDDIGVEEVTVSVDGGPGTSAVGTETWALSIDTAEWASGVHTVTATATDPAGNIGSAAVTVSIDEVDPPAVEEFSNGELAWTREQLQDPAFPDEDLRPLGQGPMPTHGDVSGVLYRDRWTGQKSVHLRNIAVGSDRYLPLQTGTGGWDNARAAMTSPSDLWVLGGFQSLVLRHFHLGGTEDGLPTEANLVKEYDLEGSDSFVGDLAVLASGGVVPVWRELGDTQVLRIGYVRPDGTRAPTLDLDFMPVYSSKQVAAQHPADGGVWVFGNADSYSNIGAVRLHEEEGRLIVDWTDPYFIGSEVGTFDVDPENPRLAVAQDPAAGTLALAYPSADRLVYSTDPWVVASTVAVARIGPDGATTFAATPFRSERVAHLGLVVTPEVMWLAFRPVDPEALSHEEIHVSRYASGTWSTPANLGTTVGSYTPVTYGLGRPEFALHLDTGGLHRFAFR